MKSDSVLVTIAIVAVLASFAGLLMNYGNFSNFNNLFTGFFIENGTVNVTIGDITSVNITSANGTADSTSLNWGSGTITDPSYALLVSNGTVYGGTFDNITQGFIIENTGNHNVNLTVMSTEDATFIGETGALFQYNLTNYEIGACASLTSEGDYVNFTTSEVIVCPSFLATNNNDTLRMDILLKIPSAATGNKVTTVVLGYEAVS